MAQESIEKTSSLIKEVGNIAKMNDLLAFVFIKYFKHFKTTEKIWKTYNEKYQNMFEIVFIIIY